MRGQVVCLFTQHDGLAPGVARVIASAGGAEGTGTITLLPSIAISGDLCDAETGQPIAARIVLRGADGRVVRGGGWGRDALGLSFPSPAATQDGPMSDGFWAAARFRAVVPPGPWTLTVGHGFDYEPFQAAGAGHADTTVCCALRRWRDLRAQGWVGMEPHKHIVHGEQVIPGATLARAALGARADGVDAFFAAQRWGDLGGSTKDEWCAALSAPDLLMAWNHEIGGPTGHSWEIGGGDYEAELDVGGVPAPRNSRANWEHQLTVRRRGGATGFTHANIGHNPATELPFAVFAGPTFDALDVITGTSYAELAQRNERLWYWLLDRGYQIAAAASTDGGLDREWASPIGGGRTYVYLGAEPPSVPARARRARGRRWPVLVPL